jgi:parallel beta-helix repeat protein
LNSNDDSVTSFTSWGPADDGRLKPDISGPGCQSNDDNGVTSCEAGGGYSVRCGTSMACPTVAGLSSLLLQDFRTNYPTRPDFRNSLLKVFLAHTAQDIQEPGPDFKTGYGSVRIQPAIDLERSGNFLENTIAQGQIFQVRVVANPGDPQIKVTLAWDDVPGTPLVSPALVNDLDLRVIAPSNTVHYPWTLDPANPSLPAVRTQPDRVNNIEQVVIDTPAPGVYRIEVEAYNVPQGPQPFSLAATPLLVACSSQGTISLDRPKYGCSTTATIQVVDCDLNTNPNVPNTTTATIASTSNPTGRSVVLTETGSQTAVFRGSIPLSTTNGLSVLLITPGDTITATYLDANDGQGGTNVTVTTTAVVDCTPPLISNVQVVDIHRHSTRVTFTTDEPAVTRVRYGTNCGGMTAEVLALPRPQTDHSISLYNLAPDTTYFFEVEAADEAGNVTIDNNGGGCYSFMTAAATIQDAINDALDGEVIIILPGTYVENINFLGKRITVRSEQGPLVTIIDGGQSGSVVRFEHGEGPDSILDGFTLTNGSGTPSDFGSLIGGGVVCQGTASPTIINNIITQNRVLGSGFGGGIAVRHSSSPTIRGNRISQNHASGQGGGIYVLVNNNTLVIKDNIIEDNEASGVGGGVACVNGAPIISGNIFARNVLGVGPGGEADGGGLEVEYSGYAPAYITNNVFAGNITAGNGGGLMFRNASANYTPQVVNNLFTGNSAINGGALYAYGTNSSLVNNTIVGNVAAESGGGIYTGPSSDLGLRNSIVRGNEGGELSLESSSIVGYCNIQGGWYGAGNINADPRFVNPGSGDFRLGSGSPCIDAGSSYPVPADRADLDDDGDTSERTPLDLDRLPRFVDDPSTPDTGFPAPPNNPQVVDMGAYEFTRDCNQNNLLDACDLDCGAAGGPCDLPGCGQGADCNDNGRLDSCDIANGTSQDVDGNGIPDECTTPCALLGDLDGNTLVNGRDIQGFVACALGGGSNCGCGDFTGNGQTDSQDITSFVAALLGSIPCSLPGDLNGDQAVNGLDISGFVVCVLGGGSCSCGDLNGDGQANVQDVAPLVTRLLTP